MAKYKKYDKYKNSGIEWIAEIPNDWAISKLKYISNITRGAILRPVDEPSYYDENGIWTYLNIADVTSCNKYLNFGELKLSKLGSSKSARVEKGNLILTASATIGKPIINNIDVCIHDGFIAFKKSKVNINYLFYFLKNRVLYDNMGKSNTQKNIYLDEVKDIFISIPGEIEQKQISDFLDKKTSEIDTLIADKEKIITLLKEKRQAIITEAVTKGLNPNFKMKDSGVEWIGEIPKHWEKTKMKYISNQIIDGTHSTPNYIDKGIPFLRVTDITTAKNTSINLKNVKYISKEEHYELIKRCHPKKGDLLVSKNGTIGIPKVVDWEFQFSIFVSLCLIKLKKSIVNSCYCSYIFESNLVDEQIANGGKKSTIVNLHLDKIKEFIIFLPPMQEQLYIVEYLKEKTKQFDDLILLTNQQIEKLKEYRQSIISEAITGKIDVRDYYKEA